MSSAHATFSSPTGNGDLYALGSNYAESIRHRVANGVRPRAALRQVAADLDQDIKEIRSAVEFRAAVDLIALNVGPRARKLILGGHPFLPPKVVMRISRTHPDRQRFAIEQVAGGRRPFAKPPAGVDPPYDTLGCGEAISRIARSTGLLDWVERGLAETADSGWPSEPKVRRMAAQLDDIGTSCSTLFALLKEPGTTVESRSTHAENSSHRQPGRPSGEPAPFSPGRVLGLVSSVRGIAEKNVRDLPRLLRESPLAPDDRTSLLEGIRRLALAATNLSSLIGGRIASETPETSAGRSGSLIQAPAVATGKARGVRVVQAQEGPLDRGGTYIVHFFLDAAATVVVGALGVFDFPAGNYFYVGSAFGPGGVRARTDRHRTPNLERKKWNIDYMKPPFRAIAAWWTHDPIKRECSWSAVLASSPGFGCPAPGFGSHDCRTNKADGFGSPEGRLCRAHLYHSVDPPSLRDFARLLDCLVPGHAPIYRQWIVSDEQETLVLHPSREGPMSTGPKGAEHRTAPRRRSRSKSI